MLRVWPTPSFGAKIRAKAEELGVEMPIFVGKEPGQELDPAKKMKHKMAQWLADHPDTEWTSADECWQQFKAQVRPLLYQHGPLLNSPSLT